MREGLREKKRRETKLRIAESALNLFIVNGFEATTLDEIAKEAAISRRTFFSYFKSKDEIMLAWQASSWENLLNDVLEVSPEVAPLEALCNIFVIHASKYESKRMIEIGRVMRSSEILMARKQAAYLVQEISLFETLCEVWREPERRQSLRLIAMISMGAMRLAIERWEKENFKRPIDCFLEDTFRGLEDILIK